MFCVFNKRVDISHVYSSRKKKSKENHSVCKDGKSSMTFSLNIMRMAIVSLDDSLNQQSKLPVKQYTITETFDRDNVIN